MIRFAIPLVAFAFVACAGSHQSKDESLPPPTTAVPPAVAVLEPSATTETPAPSASAGAIAPKAASVTKANFGSVDGKQVDIYTLSNANGLVLKVMNFGAIVTELDVPGRQGKKADVVGGFESLDPYTKDTNPHFGGIVGRVANRIRNASFSLEGRTYKLAANDHGNSLHGGKKGFDKVIWEAEPIDSPEGPAVKLVYQARDGEEGYPGNLKATVTYALTNANELRIDMSATTDKTTIVNLAQQNYWNLGGVDSASILDHELTIYADKYTPGDPVPNGAVKSVKGTPFDFMAAKVIGADLKAAGGTPVGYDHNYVVWGDQHALRPVAKLKDPVSGRTMTLEADQPGLQFYTGNFLDGSLKGKGTTYNQYAMLCLETQKFPNSINVRAWKDEVVLKPGKTYKHTMVAKFTIE